MPGWRLLCCCSSDGRCCVRGWAGCGTCTLGGSSALSPLSPHLQQQQQPAQTHENRALGEAARATASRALPIQVLPHVPAATAATPVVCSFGDTAIMRTIYVSSDSCRHGLWSQKMPSLETVLTVHISHIASVFLNKWPAGVIDVHECTSFMFHTIATANILVCRCQRFGVTLCLHIRGRRWTTGSSETPVYINQTSLATSQKTVIFSCNKYGSVSVRLYFSDVIFRNSAT